MTKLISGVLGFVLASILAVVAAVLTTTPARVAPSFNTIEENKEDASALNRISISGQKDDNEPINVDTSTASHHLEDGNRDLRAPAVGWVKLNVDTGVKTGVGTGAVCRDSTGKVLCGFTYQRREVWEPQLCARWIGGSDKGGTRQYVVESDCAQVIADVKTQKIADDPKGLEGVESSLDDSESTKCSSSVRYVRNSEETAAIRDVRNCRIRKKLVMKNTTCICVCSSGNSGDCTSTQSMLDNNIGMNTNGSGQQYIGPVSTVTYQGDYVATQIIHINVFPTNRQLTFIFLELFYFGRHHRATR